MLEVLTVARFLSGGFFVWSSSHKLNRSSEFWKHILGYEIVGPRTARLLAATLPPAEFIMGLLFAAGLYPHVIGVALIVMIVGYSGAVVLSLIRKTGNECGCGARGGKVRPQVLLRNMLLTLLVIGGMNSNPATYVGGIWVVLSAMLVFIIVSTHKYKSLGK